MTDSTKRRLLQHLAEAERHVERGRHHLRRQCDIIDQLKRDGHDTSSARDLMLTLEQTQLLHIADRDRIREEIEQHSALQMTADQM